MQISFRLLCQAKLLRATRENLDAEYEEAKERAKQVYMAELMKAQREYAPYYASLKREIEFFWREVRKETGVQNTDEHSVLESGALVHNDKLTGLCSDII